MWSLLLTLLVISQFHFGCTADKAPDSPTASREQDTSSEDSSPDIPKGYNENVSTQSKQELEEEQKQQIHQKLVKFNTIEHDFIDNTENLTPQGVIRFLKQAGYINDKFSFSQIELIKIENLRTGFFSDQIYMVIIPAEFNKSAKVNRVIVKILNPDASPQSADSIKAIKTYLAPREFMIKKDISLKTENKKIFPTLILPKKVGYWLNIKNNPRYVVFMPLAEGKQLMQVGKELFKQDGSFSSQMQGLWNEYMTILGKSTGAFHRTLMNRNMDNLIKNTKEKINSLDDLVTVIHGDLHLENVFFDINKKHITFIDLDTIMTYLYNPVSVKRDLARFYTQTLLTFMTFLTEDQMKEFNKGFISFAKGYAEGFPEQQNIVEELVLKYFSDIHKECKDYFNNIIKLEPVNATPTVTLASMNHFMNSNILPPNEGPEHLYEKPRFHMHQVLLYYQKEALSNDSKRQKSQMILKRMAKNFNVQ